MLKRTKGYTLLLLLVLTGLAGRLFTTTITSQERRFLIDHLKASKAMFIKSVKGLSEEQLNFKASAGKWSIKDCMQHITLAENSLWSLADATLKQAANAEKRAEIKISDEALAKMIMNREQKAQAPEFLKPEQANWKTANEILDAFKEKRGQLIKYAKTTTEDMRNHVAQMPFGYIDAYQLIVFISAHTRRHIMQIEEVKANPAFPK
jgi:hypothetical protein